MQPLLRYNNSLDNRRLFLLVLLLWDDFPGAAARGAEVPSPPVGPRGRRDEGPLLVPAQPLCAIAAPDDVGLDVVLGNVEGVVDGEVRVRRGGLGARGGLQGRVAADATAGGPAQLPQEVHLASGVCMIRLVAGTTISMALRFSFLSLMTPN